MLLIHYLRLVFIKVDLTEPKIFYECFSEYILDNIAISSFVPIKILNVFLLSSLSTFSVIIMFS